MNLTRLMPFCFILLSSVAFSLATFLIRLFFQEKLPLIIDFQSTSVFLIFILQMGLRTGIRLHFHSGYEKTVERVFNSVNGQTFLLGMGASFITYWFSNRFFFSFCFSQAILSFNQGLFVARKEFLKAITSSILIFTQIIISVAFIVFCEKKISFLAIELSSIALLFVFRYFFSTSSKTSLKATVMLIKKYFSLQMGAFVVYGAMFLFAQNVIKYGVNSPDLILAYADATIVGGVILLLAGKGIVFIEGKIIEEKKFLDNLLRYLVFVAVFAGVYTTIISYFMSYEPSWALACMLFLLGRFSFSYVSQFSNSKSRILLYSIGSLVTLFLLFLNYFEFSYSFYRYILLVLNLNLAVIVFIVFYRFNSKRMFI